MHYMLYPRGDVKKMEREALHSIPPKRRKNKERESLHAIARRVSKEKERETLISIPPSRRKEELAGGTICYNPEET
jgi:hypothetical protein